MAEEIQVNRKDAKRVVRLWYESVFKSVQVPGIHVSVMKPQRDAYEYLFNLHLKGHNQTKFMNASANLGSQSHVGKHLVWFP